jgi:hypothetical protein
VQRDVDAEPDEASRLRQQLDAAQRETTTLLAAVQAVQRAVALTSNSAIAATEASPPIHTSSPVAEESHTPAVRKSIGRVPHVGNKASSSAIVAAAHARSGEQPPANDAATRDIDAYVTQLLTDIEAMYHADRSSERTPAAVIDRLTANLRYAREVLLRRVGSTPRGEILFKDQLRGMLDVYNDAVPKSACGDRRRSSWFPRGTCASTMSHDDLCVGKVDGFAMLVIGLTSSTNSARAPRARVQGRFAIQSRVVAR